LLLLTIVVTSYFVFVHPFSCFLSDDGFLGWIILIQKLESRGARGGSGQFSRESRLHLLKESAVFALLR
jgi:hypothetical protein